MGTAFHVVKHGNSTCLDFVHLTRSREKLGLGLVDLSGAKAIMLGGKRFVTTFGMITLGICGRIYW